MLIGYKFINMKYMHTCKNALKDAVIAVMALTGKLAVIVKIECRSNRDVLINCFLKEK